MSPERFVKGESERTLEQKNQCLERLLLPEVFVKEPVARIRSRCKETVVVRCRQAHQGTVHFAIPAVHSILLASMFRQGLQAGVQYLP